MMFENEKRMKDIEAEMNDGVEISIYYTFL